MNAKAPAFTFAEMMIVVAVVAIVSVGLSVSSGSIRESVEFDEVEEKIASLIQKARSLSFSSEAEYFLVEISEDKVELSSHTADDAEDPILGSAQLSTGMEITAEEDLPIQFYYFSPDGELCFTADCSDTVNAKSFSISAREGSLQTQFSIDIFGGYPELTRQIQ